MNTGVMVKSPTNPGGTPIEEFDKLTGTMKKVRYPSVLLCPKDEVKQQISRSPDRADAWVLSLAERPFVAAGPQRANFRFR